MNTLLNDDFAIAYLDDILIMSESQEQHAKHVKEIFEKIKQNGLNLSFLKSKMKYLRLIVDAKDWKPDPSNSSAKKNMPTPTNVSTLQSFLRLANYYSNFITNMHVLSAPQNKLLKKDLR